MFDNMARDSNYGKCVNIFAPGVDILSAWTNHGVSMLSGSSMAVPFVAGVFAAFLSSKFYTTQELYDEVTNLSTKGIVKNVPENTINRLLYVPY